MAYQINVLLAFATGGAVLYGAWSYANYYGSANHKQVGIRWAAIATALSFVLMAHLYGAPDEDDHFLAHVIMYVIAVWGSWLVLRLLFAGWIFNSPPERAP
ncbi:MAG TPA: hypothetical protein VF439_03975 [Candidatus Paceibacterota bacterium]